MHHVKLKPAAVVAGIAALLFAAAMVVVAPQKAAATPAYAQSTGKPCGQCHANPAGGGKLTAFGSKFQANGHKLP